MDYSTRKLRSLFFDGFRIHNGVGTASMTIALDARDHPDRDGPNVRITFGFDAEASASYAETETRALETASAILQRLAAVTGADLQALLRATEERQAQPFKLDLSALDRPKSENELDQG